MTHNTLLWVGFLFLVLVMLALDLLVVNRKAHEVKLKEAATWSVIWITLGLLFAVFIYFEYEKNPRPETLKIPGATATDGLIHGKEAALQYLTGYVVEKALSVDNLFVFLVIFSYFGVPTKLQHRVLFWGIVGALVFRAIFIFAGVALIHRFHWIIYVFGVVLIYTGIKMLLEHGKQIHPEKNPVLRLVRKVFPVTTDFQGSHFFVTHEEKHEPASADGVPATAPAAAPADPKKAGRLMATPLFIALVVVETTDIIFAVDSIPAIMGFTQDPYIIFTSNVFAILGLRALFFALAGFMKLLAYLSYGLAAILVFVGLKMLIGHWVHIDTKLSLGVVGGILLVTVVASVLFPKKTKPGEPEPAPTKL